MSVTYINRKGQTYYLHQGTTKTGKPKYFFSMKNEGDLVENIPDGFEIYENPNAKVFLQKIQPKIITDEEKIVVESGLNKFSSSLDYQINIKKEIITVYTADQDINVLSEIVKHYANTQVPNLQTALRRSISYSPMLRFILVDEEKRIFTTQRYCFLGSIDDWIDIGNEDNLPKLVETYVKHLGQDSFYELH